jgi:hypothetical protein
MRAAALAESNKRFYPWAVGFFVSNIELNM